jgi:dihydroflavonol-4-reductase
MTRTLVTGATGFLGYHVVRHLNEQGIKPRVLELRGGRSSVLDALDVERCEGDLDDPGAILAACGGADTVLHLAFKVGLGGGAALLAEMRRVNVDGTRRLLRIAASAGVRRAVITGSALAVGVNRRAAPLDERADWGEHALDLPYALMRREAELNAHAQCEPGFEVLSVCPAFTFGPDDPVGAPANALVRRLLAGRLPFTLRVGFGCLDVRDFARGMVLAAERGRPRERYLLSGENVTATELLQRAAAIGGVRAPRFAAPKPLLHVAIGVVEAVSRLRRRNPPVTRRLLDIIDRFAWYDTSRARTELGWVPRPLDETLADTIAWLRGSGASAARGAATGV